MDKYLRFRNHAVKNILFQSELILRLVFLHNKRLETNKNILKGQEDWGSNTISEEKSRKN